MKITQQCDFNKYGTGLRCPNNATCKYGDNWFCDYHGARPKNACKEEPSTIPDDHAVIDRKKLWLSVSSFSENIAKRITNGETIHGSDFADEFMDQFWLFGGIEPKFEDTQRLNVVEWMFRNYPNVKIYVNEDQDIEDDYGVLIPVGATIALTGCQGTDSVTGECLRDALDLMSNARNG